MADHVIPVSETKAPVQRPRLKELPVPTKDKTGWPWTEESPVLPNRMTDGSSWPKVSIVTPALNHADFIEETIRSVLLQGYPFLEYIIIDGGSDDGTVDIIRKYSPWLAYWVSEPDDGQSNAINKGFQQSTGTIMAWLNSDDTYYPGSLGVAANNLLHAGGGILIGAMDKVQANDGLDEIVVRSSPHSGAPIHAFPIFANGRIEKFQFIQPSMFWYRSIWQQTGGLDERYHFCMDREWCLRAMAKGSSILTSEEVLSRFTLHSGSKSYEYESEFQRERALMYWRFRRMSGFRMFPCMLDSLLHQLRKYQDIYYARSSELNKNGHREKALAALFFARIVRRARLGMNYIARISRATHAFRQAITGAK